MSRNKYARGKKALGICDRCGLTYRYLQLKTEVVDDIIVNNRVCPECFDPDHPQNRAGKIDYSDAISLRQPRTDTTTGSEFIDRRQTTAAYCWEFDTYELGREADQNSTMDWMPEGSGTLTWNSAGSSGSQNGTATLVTVGSDEGMTRDTSAALNGLWFSSNDYDFARIRMRVVVETQPADWSGIFSFRRSFDSVGQYKELPLAPRPEAIKQMGDQWFILEYDLGADATWVSTIRELRFQPYNTAGNTVEIDYIRLEKK
jgi:hypothetical protein